jgi:hypothetical protein
MVIPMYLYFGLGYCYQSYTQQLSSGKWARNRFYSLNHSLNAEIGLQGNIKGFTLSAGYVFMTGSDFMHEVKVGLGYTFKTE